MRKKRLAKNHPDKSIVVQRVSMPTAVELSKIDRTFQVALHSSSISQPVQGDVERFIDIVRTELKLSFWQSLAISLFIFILGLFATILIILLQR